MKMVGTKIGNINNLGVYDTMKFSRIFFIPAIKAIAQEGDKDAQKLVNTMTDDTGKTRSTLSSIARAFNIDTSNAHTAMADVENTIEIFRGIINYVDDRIDDFIKSEKYEEERQKAILQEREYKKKRK
jgi:hypothetical protein